MSDSVDAVRRLVNRSEPDPIHNDSKAVWEMVVEDMQERDRVGLERYGTRLQAGNGRDALVDAYQETLDQAVYLRQEIEERRNKALWVVVDVKSDDALVWELVGVFTSELLADRACVHPRQCYWPLMPDTIAPLETTRALNVVYPRMPEIPEEYNERS